MQLQFRSEYKKYLQRSGFSQDSGVQAVSNRLLGEMVKKGSAIDTPAMLEARKHGSGKLAKAANKENTPGNNCGAAQAGPLPNMGSANIDKIIQFIEGGPQDEAAFKKAQKKARQKQKKDDERRQREEEEEAHRRAEAARIQKEQELAEQQRIKEELALQKQLKKLKKKQNQTNVQPPPTTSTSNDSKSKKKKKQQQITQQNEPEPQSLQEEPQLFEQTIPAMVTIKRIVENNNSPPTVTITLKGSTPDQDKLLYTLVNGHDAPIITSKCSSSENTQKPTKNATKQNGSTAQNDKQKKKTKNETQSNTKNEVTNTKHVQTSEIKVNLAIDSSFRKDLSEQMIKSQKQSKKTENKTASNNTISNNTSNNSKNVKKQEVKTSKDGKTSKTAKNSGANESKTKPVKTSSSSSLNSNTNSTSSLSSSVQQDIIDIPSIKLPPGITITKVNGPLANRKNSTGQQNEYPDVPVSKSGVIVVDTEKLIQQQTESDTGTSATSKKKKKKAKKAAAAAAAAGVTIIASQTAQNGGVNPNKTKPDAKSLIKSNETTNPSSSTASSSSGSSGMVTLKNPIFHPLSGMQKPTDDEMPHMININEQATISHGENGMVTIRRPRRPIGFMQNNESSISEYLAKNAATSAHPTSSAPTSSPSPQINCDSAPKLPHAASSTTPNSSNPPILTPWQMPDTSFSALTEDRKIIRPPSPRGVQWPRADVENGKLQTPSVLQGLPGIEITRVRTGSPVVEQEYVEAPANVSIIRTGGYNNVTDKPQSWAYSAQP